MQLQFCYKEIKDLKKIIQRKDEELAQFKREGYSIRRGVKLAIYKLKLYI